MCFFHIKDISLMDLIRVPNLVTFYWSLGSLKTSHFRVQYPPETNVCHGKSTVLMVTKPGKMGIFMGELLVSGFNNNLISSLLEANELKQLLGFTDSTDFHQLNSQTPKESIFHKLDRNHQLNRNKKLGDHSSLLFSLVFLNQPNF